VRKRLLSPKFFSDPKVLKLPPLERLLFQGLWCQADRVGVLPDDPEQLSIELLPRDPIDVDAALARMASLGLVERYQVGGRAWVRVTHFGRHQRPHPGEAESGYPLPSARVNGKVHRKDNLGTPQTADDGTFDVVPSMTGPSMAGPSESALPSALENAVEVPPQIIRAGASRGFSRKR
jgi:hypothetical protein